MSAGTDSSGNGAQVVLQDVHKRFGALHALRGVSLVVRKNEFITLLGPSGCGKTTLLRLIGGFEEPDAGLVAVAGRSVAETPPRARHTRMVFQHYALFPHMTVRQNVEFGLRVRRIPPADRAAKIGTILRLVQLSDKAAAHPGQLSGGQQQRVALARALVTEPDVLLLDEPLAALDLQLRKTMQLELKTLQRELGITFIYVTHDQTEALTMSDRVVVMKDGAIEQVGSVDEVYERPASRFVAGFIGEANIFDGRAVFTEKGLTVQIDDFQVSGPTPSNLQITSGQGVTLMIRPERIILSDSTPAGPNSVSCRVVDRIFMGAFSRFILTTPAGRRIVADVTLPSDLQVSAPVTVHLPASGMRWLEKN